MRGSGVAGTSSALFWREQTFGIDLSLERRPERLPGGSGRLARVVGRVESMCTDPSAEGPTGPFGLVHLMGPCPYRRFRCPAGGRVAPALLGQRACLRSPSLSCLASPFCPSRAWGRVRRRREKRPDPTPSTAGLQVYCVRYGVHVAPCGPLYANSYTLGAASPKARIREKAS